MRGNGGTLRVRNLAQKVLWEEELTGQLSDGRWENSRPMDHWMPWCDATVVIDPENVGRDFWVRRDGYCFTEKDLLSIIGDRMLEAVRVATGNAAYSEKKMLADLRDLRKIIKLQVSAALPVPPQPLPRKAKLIVDGYPQEFTVYYKADDDPIAVEKLAERERANAEYRFKRLEKEYAEARTAADKIGLELEELRVKLGGLLV